MTQLPTWELYPLEDQSSPASFTNLSQVSGTVPRVYLCSISVCVCVCVCVCVYFMAAPVVYGDSQARGLIRTIAAGLPHSHSNVESEPRLQPIPQLTATTDP